MIPGHLALIEVCGQARAPLDRASSANGAPRAARLALSGLFAGLLAACGAGTDESTGASAGGSVTATAASACTSAPASFTNTVWKDVNASCTTCHAQGRVAGGTNLVFVAAGTDLQNYNILRDFSKGSGDLVLSKSIGMPAHAGGKPFVDANSTQYKALAALVPEMAAQVCQTTTTTTNPGATTASGGYWSGVQFVSDATVLGKASVLFAGRNPTSDEVAAAASGTPALRSAVRGYMQGPVFDRFLNDVGDTHFLTPGVVVRGNNTGLVAADWPTSAGAVLGAANVTQVAGAVRNRFDASVRREPIELMKFIVKNDRPYTDMVTGNYTVANGVLTQFLGATVQGAFTNVDDDNEWRQASLPSARLGGTREHAGVLSSHAWLQRNATTDTNRNRHRVNVLFKQFLATDVSALAVRPLDDGAKFKVPTVENPACAVCHDVMDPVAAGFQNWNERNRYLPNVNNGVNHALPATYRAGSYPKDANNQAYYQAGDNWFRDGKAPGFGATPMPGGFTGNPTALQWLGQQMAADPRFALGAVYFWYEGLFGRTALKAPFDQSSPQFAANLAAYTAQNDEFKAVAARFATDRGNGAYNVKDLLVDLMMSQWFRADRVTALNATRAVELQDVGSTNMLLPSQLNLKMIGLLGQGWNEFDNPYAAGMGLNYGDFDGNQRVNRAKSHTMMQSIAIDRLVSVRSCTFTKTDFDKPMADRMLFRTVNLSDLPDSTAGRDAIAENIRFLHKHLWKDDVPVTDAEVQRTLKLFTDIWGDRATASAKPVNCVYNQGNDANYTGRAWAAVIAYMIGDPKFLYE